MTYDRDRVEGMTQDDMIATLSTTLSGSPAQVEWGTAIRARVNDEFDRVASSFRSVAKKQTVSKKAETEAILAILENKRAEVLSHDEAGYFIHDWNEISDQVRQMIFQDSSFQAIRAARPTGKSFKGDS